MGNAIDHNTTRDSIGAPLPGQVETTQALHALPVVGATVNTVYDDPRGFAAAAADRATRTREVIFCDLRSMLRVGLAGGQTVAEVAGEIARAHHLKPKTARLLLKGLRRIATGIEFAEWSRGDRDVPLVRAIADAE